MSSAEQRTSFDPEGDRRFLFLGHQEIMVDVTSCEIDQ